VHCQIAVERSGQREEMQAAKNKGISKDKPDRLTVSRAAIFKQLELDTFRLQPFRMSASDQIMHRPVLYAKYLPERATRLRKGNLFGHKRRLPHGDKLPGRRYRNTTLAWGTHSDMRSGHLLQQRAPSVRQAIGQLKKHFTGFG
jgi:hypothetical protein